MRHAFTLAALLAALLAGGCSTTLDTRDMGAGVDVRGPTWHSSETDTGPALKAGFHVSGPEVSVTALDPMQLLRGILGGDGSEEAPAAPAPAPAEVQQTQDDLAAAAAAARAEAAATEDPEARAQLEKQAERLDAQAKTIEELAERLEKEGGRPSIKEIVALVLANLPTEWTFAGIVSALLAFLMALFGLIRGKKVARVEASTALAGAVDSAREMVDAEKERAFTQAERDEIEAIAKGGPVGPPST